MKLTLRATADITAEENKKLKKVMTKEEAEVNFT